MGNTGETGDTGGTCEIGDTGEMGDTRETGNVFMLLIQFSSSMHHYKCIALCKDISLQRG